MVTNSALPFGTDFKSLAVVPTQQPNDSRHDYYGLHHETDLNISVDMSKVASVQGIGTQRAGETDSSSRVHTHNTHSDADLKMPYTNPPTPTAVGVLDQTCATSLSMGREA